MKRFDLALRWLIIAGLVVTFCLSLEPASVQAAVSCINTIPITDGTDDDFDLSVQLSGNSVVWSKITGEIFHYNLVTTSITQIGSMKTAEWWENFLTVDGDHVAWIDPANQIQLYTVSSATTLQVTNDTRLKTDIRLDGNYVLWRQGKTEEKMNKLFVYDIAAATSTKITKTFFYELNQGRVLWAGNLYDLAAATTTFLGEVYWAKLSGDYVAGIYLAVPDGGDPNYPAPQLAIKNLSTGVTTRLTNNSFRTFIDDFSIRGDYVTWSEHYGLEWSANLFLHHISTGETNPFGSASDSGTYINGRFISYLGGLEETSNFVIHDVLSGFDNAIYYTPGVNSAVGDVDNDRIAWMEYQEDEDYENYDLQVILRTDCGANPTIINRTPNMNILTGRSVNLSITTTGDQPITYQWYQGQVGDTTTPVGENSTSFTTPPLTETTSYWVHTANYFGIEDSEAMTLTVGATAELVIDSSFEQSLYYGALSKVWETVTYGVSHRCNQPDKPPVAHTGDCAARLKGQEYNNLKITQHFFSEIPYASGDTLTLSAWLQAKHVAIEDAAILLKVRYTDDTRAKVVLKPTEAEFAYTQFTADPLTITGTVSKAQIIIKYTNRYGEWFVDDVSLLHQPASAAVLPLPPSGLTGSK